MRNMIHITSAVFLLGLTAVMVADAQSVATSTSSEGVWRVSTSSAIADHANSQAKGSLAAIVREIGDQPATVELPGSTIYPISSDLTIPGGVVLRFGNGAVLSVTEKKTLTINSEIEAGARPIFAGKGRIADEPNILAVLLSGSALGATGRQTIPKRFRRPSISPALRVSCSSTLAGDVTC